MTGGTPLPESTQANEDQLPDGTPLLFRGSFYLNGEVHGWTGLTCSDCWGCGERPEGRCMGCGGTGEWHGPMWRWEE